MSIKGIDLKIELVERLSEPNAPRVIPAAQLHALSNQIRPGIAQSSSRAAGEALAGIGALRKVATGLFLNRRALPPAELVEAAEHLRVGAHISLHTGVGGAHNNPSRVIHAVREMTPGDHPPNVGSLVTATNDEFHFHGLPSRFFPRDDAERRLLLARGARCPTFSPEASFLHWLHLGRSGRSTLQRPPPGDIEFADESDINDRSGLRMSVLEATASRYGMQDELAEWLADWRYAHGEERAAAAEPEATPRRRKP